MAALSALRTDLRKRYQDASGNFLSAQPANQFINNAVEEFVNETEPLFREYGWVVTAKQFRYDLPADWVKPKTVMWYQTGPRMLDYVTPKRFQQLGYLNKQSTGTPRVYTMIENDLYLGPAPGTTSNTSTLSGAHSSTVTTINVADGTKFASPAGVILINSEQIAYQNVNSNALELALRAQGGTTAASHSSADVVKRMDLVAVYYYTAPALSADADVPAIDARWHRLVLHNALGQALMMGGRTQEAALEFQLYEQKKEEAKREIRKQQRDTLTFIHNVY